MKNDRESLELAAKAAGVVLDADGSIDGEIGGMSGDWNPLTDDGDALRLAVKLGLFMLRIVKEIPRKEYDADPYAATRRAIVRAAAELGSQEAREVQT